MSKLVINGGYPLCGVVRIQGAKNSVLPIMAAALLAEDECVIENVPDISDLHSAIEILSALGAQTTLYENKIVIDSRYAKGFEIPDTLMRKMRSSIMFLGAILSVSKRAKVSFPGGCEIGNRPIDLHISALKKMNVTIHDTFGYIDCETKGLLGANITLSFPSVGATENIMLAAVKADGVTVINNAAKEPEITDLQDFLNVMGGRVSGAGTSVITISGVKRLHGARYKIIPDRIVASTYLCAVAATRGNALFKNVDTQHLSVVLSLLRDAGCKIDEYHDSVSIECDKINHVDTVNLIRTMPYPGFPTDAGPPFVSLMALATGSTVFVETIFENRFKYIGELLRMGANIKVEGRVAVVEGVNRLYGTSVEAYDLRGGAALCVAGLAAEGETEILNAGYIERGYEHIDRDLQELGGKIELIDGGLQ